MIPNGRTGADLKDTMSFPVPARHRQALPPCGLAMQDVPQGRKPLSFLPRTAVRARGTKRGRFLQSRIQTQAGDDSNLLPNQGMQPFQSGKGTIADHHQRSIWQPALGLENHLPRPVQHRFMTLPVFLPIAFARRQTGEER